MKTGFIIAGIIELIAGIFIFFSPASLINGQLETLSMVRMYGIAIIIIGIIALLAWRNYEANKFIRQLFVTIMGFQMCLCFYSHAMFRQGVFENLGATITHGVIFVCLLLLYLKDVK